MKKWQIYLTAGVTFLSVVAIAVSFALMAQENSIDYLEWVIALLLAGVSFLVNLIVLLAIKLHTGKWFPESSMIPTKKA